MKHTSLFLSLLLTIGLSLTINLSDATKALSAQTKKTITSSQSKKIVKKKPIAKKTVSKEKKAPLIAPLKVPSPLSDVKIDESALLPSTLDMPRGPVIEEAPKDDYGFVAWCHGVLSGHMALAEHLAEVAEPDESIKMIGASYLRAYEAALTLAKNDDKEAQKIYAEDARLMGFSKWDLAFKADKNNGLKAYNGWSLPGECEHAAVRLSGREHLFNELASEDEMKVITKTLEQSAENIGALPAPKITAKNAPEDTETAVSTRRRLPN